MGKGIINSRHIIYAPVIVVVVVLAYECTRPPKPKPKPLAGVHAVCSHCGMSYEEVAGIIESIQASSGNLSREESLGLYHATFDDDAEQPERAIKSECDDCAVAILDWVYGELAKPVKKP